MSFRIGSLSNNFLSNNIKFHFLYQNLNNAKFDLTLQNIFQIEIFLINIDFDIQHFFNPNFHFNLILVLNFNFFLSEHSYIFFFNYRLRVKTIFNYSTLNDISKFDFIPVIAIIRLLEHIK